MKACVNPDHLYLGTHADNMDDLNIRGSKGNTKLTRRDVLEIRERAAQGATKEELADLFNVSSLCIRDVARHWSWSYVGGPQTFI